MEKAKERSNLVVLTFTMMRRPVMMTEPVTALWKSMPVTTMMMCPRLPIVSSNPALPSSWPLTPATAHGDVIHGLVANQTRLHQEVLRAQRETEAQPQDGVRPVGTDLRSPTSLRVE
ncbi:hypothetical protein QOT17_000437 [Balamuthia mandrillaris]